MLVRPVYNILLLPDVSYYFKKEFFEFASKAEAMSGLQPELNGMRILNKTQAKDVVKGGWVSNPEFLHDVMNRVTKGAYKDSKDAG